VSELLLPNLPGARDWLDVREAAERLRKPGQTSITLQLTGTSDPRAVARWKRLRDSRFFLVRNRNGGTGERYHCGLCSTYHVERGVKVLDPIYHEFFTLCCVNQPFRGLDGALWGYASLINDRGIQRRVLDWMPDAGLAHPQTFGRMVKEPGEELIAVALGVLEDITETRARNLAEMINGRRPPTPFRL
jgi:hypothetical protein